MSLLLNSQCKWDEARQRIYLDPTCVCRKFIQQLDVQLFLCCADTLTCCILSITTILATNTLTTTVVPQSSVGNQYKVHFQNLVQLIIETSHWFVLEIPEIVSQYKIPPKEQSILLIQDCNGNIPLHITCQSWNASQNIMSLLFEHCKETQPAQPYKIPTAIDLILHKNE